MPNQKVRLRELWSRITQKQLCHRHHQGTRGLPNSGHAVSDHFVDITEMVGIGSGAPKITPTAFTTKWAAKSARRFTNWAARCQRTCPWPRASKKLRAGRKSGSRPGKGKSLENNPNRERPVWNCDRVKGMPHAAGREQRLNASTFAKATARQGKLRLKALQPTLNIQHSTLNIQWGYTR